MLAASSNVFASADSVVKFNGFNYAEWFEQIQFTLSVMALDSAILTDEEPSAITVDSSEYESLVMKDGSDLIGWAWTLWGWR